MTSGNFKKPLEFDMFSSGNREILNIQVDVWYITKNQADGRAEFDQFNSLKEAEEFIKTLEFEDIQVSIQTTHKVEFNPKVLK